MPRKKTPAKQKDPERIRIGERVTIWIEPETSPFWYLSFSHLGKQHRPSLKTTSKKAARQMAMKKEVELQEGTFIQQSSRPKSVREIMADRLARKALQSSSKTVGAYDRHDRRLSAFLPRGGKEPVSSLDVRLLERYESALRETGIAMPPNGRGVGGRRAKPLAAKTIRDEMKSARGLIRFAMARGDLSHDPAAAYELPKENPKDIEVFTVEEQNLLREDLEMGDVWAFFIATCLRSDEFLWLLKDDVVWESGCPTTLKIRHKTCPQTGKSWGPKHGRERLVPLTKRAAKILSRAVSRSRSPWAFESDASRGCQPGRWTYGPVRTRLRLRLDEIGAPMRGLHSLRHTGATYLANDARMPIAQLQKFLGHSRLAETQRYLHPSADDIAATLAQIDD